MIRGERPCVLAASAAAADGAEHIEVPVAYDGIVLAGFGGPEGQDDVIPFLRNVTRGRGIPDERLEEVAHHYRHFGGISPINQQNRELKAALEEELARRNIDLPVLWGNRNWQPYLRDTIAQSAADGHRTLIAIATSAYSSYSGCRQYREDLAQALSELGDEHDVRIDKIRPFFDHPGFVQPFVEGLRSAVAQLREEHPTIAANEVAVLFSTHSIPIADAERSGPGSGSAYVEQHQAVAQVIMDQACPEFTPAHQLVYQSRSGPASVPWLEPDINEVIAALPDAGSRAVIVVPIGFVSDHMEVLWDLDVEAKDSAQQAQLWFSRVSTPGIHPAYVRALVDLVVERIEGTPAAQRPALTRLGPWFDVCRPGCCENVRRGFSPAVGGVAP